MKWVSTCLLLSLFATACGGDDGPPTEPGPPSPTTGTVQVSMGMEGADLDADGCGVSLDGGNPRILTNDQTTHFTGVLAGSHTVGISDLADNCVLAGPDTRTVTLVAGDTAAVAYAATCARIVRLAFLVQPSDTEIGGPLWPRVQVATQDASGTTITDAATEITVRALAEGGEIALTRSESVVDGVASFDDIRLLTVGTFSLDATAVEAIPAISETFSVTYPPIAFGSTEGDTWDVLLLDATEIVNLTNHPADDSRPAWSPDGTRIAFASNRDGDFDIYVMKPDGSEVIQLTDDPSWDDEPSWSPDGTRIVFSSSRDGMNICVMDADGSDVQCIADSRGVNYSPDWSPDGTEIAWMGPGLEKLDICVMGVDGSNARCITQNSVLEHVPKWSPDGSRIAYYSEEADGTWDVHVIDADGADEANLTSSPGVHDYTPDWSPDGNWLVLGSNREPGGGLYMMKPDGTDVIRLAVIGGVSPAWRP